MQIEPTVMKRKPRVRSQDPVSVHWESADELDLMVVDVTWDELQTLQCVLGVVTFGELELLGALNDGAVLIDSRLPESRIGEGQDPGRDEYPHEQVLEVRDQLVPSRLSVFFCNGPQCPQSPAAVRALLEAGYPASGLAYYRGGLHDWLTLAMPTESVSVS